MGEAKTSEGFQELVEEVTQKVYEGVKERLISDKTLENDIKKILAKNLEEVVVEKYTTENEKAKEGYFEEISQIQKKRKRERRVTQILVELGVSANLKGYRYLRTAILLSIEDESYLDSIVKRLYFDVAKEHNNTTPPRVERAIRHCITVMWDRGDYEKINEIFGFTVDSRKGRPTNSEFIAKIVDWLKLEMN